MDKLPIYHTIEIDQDAQDLSTILRLLKENSQNEVPTYIDLTSYPADTAFQLATKIENAMNILTIDFHFPYPTYLVYPEIFPKKLQISIFKTVQDLPDFFHQESRRPKAKELILLNRSKLRATRIKNISLKDRYQQIEEYGQNNKKIYKLNRQIFYLRDLINKLKNDKYKII